MGKNILYKTEYEINEYIKVAIPTIGEIINNNEVYCNIAEAIIATPYDMMNELDDIGVDFSTTTDWDLFCYQFKGLRKANIGCVLKGIDLNEYEAKINRENKELFFENNGTGTIIDRVVHGEICSVIREIMCLERPRNKKPANEEAKKYMIERARKKKKRIRAQPVESRLESRIISLVNAPEFPYNFETVLDVTIYQFNKSARQIVRRLEYENLMTGYFMGTVDIEKIDQKDLEWLN